MDKAIFPFNSAVENVSSVLVRVVSSAYIINLNFSLDKAKSLGGQTSKSHGKLSNGWTDWHQIWYTSVDSSGNGHRLKQLAPRYPRAALWVVLWGQQFKRLGNCGQTDGRIGNQFCTYNADESGNGQQLNKLAP